MTETGPVPPPEQRWQTLRIIRMAGISALLLGPLIGFMIARSGNTQQAWLIGSAITATGLLDFGLARFLQGVWTKREQAQSAGTRGIPTYR